MGTAVGHPVGMEKQRGRKALRVLAGIVGMAVFVVICLAILTRYAGGWGVPYFSFSTERGSPCVNKLTGYVCSPLNLADVEYYGDIDLPDDTQVISGTYTSTHDYRLESQLAVPASSAPAAWKGLSRAYGQCLRGHPVPMNTAGLTQLCVLANDDAVVESGEPASRLYTIGTGVRKDGTRVIDLSIHSR